MADKYIKLDEKKIKRLIREAQMFQDDIVCAIGTDFMRNIAEAENKMIFDILKGLLSEPAADVVEVKHAYWKETTHITISKRNREIHSTLYNCSYCDAPNGRKKSSFCHWCGAKMDGEETAVSE